jgi:hypothetical protein
MPSPPPAPNVLRVQSVFDLGGDLEGGVRQYWLYSGGPPSPSNAGTIATNFSSIFGTYLAGLMSHNFSLIQVNVEDLSSSTGAVGDWTGSVPGVNEGNEVTVDTCVLQNSQIKRRYRGGRPRTYWPFGIEGNLNADGVTWEASFLTSVEDNYTSYVNQVISDAGSGCSIEYSVNVSFYDGFTAAENPVTGRWRNIPKYRTGSAVIDQISGFTFRPEISQQKRRRTSTRP